MPRSPPRQCVNDVPGLPVNHVPGPYTLPDCRSQRCAVRPSMVAFVAPALARRIHAIPTSRSPAGQSASVITFELASSASPFVELMIVTVSPIHQRPTTPHPPKQLSSLAFRPHPDGPIIVLSSAHPYPAQRRRTRCPRPVCSSPSSPSLRGRRRRRRARAQTVLGAAPAPVSPYHRRPKSAPRLRNSPARAAPPPPATPLRSRRPQPRALAATPRCPPHRSLAPTAALPAWRVPFALRRPSSSVPSSSSPPILALPSPPRSMPMRPGPPQWSHRRHPPHGSQTGTQHAFIEPRHRAFEGPSGPIEAFSRSIHRASPNP